MATKSSTESGPLPSRRRFIGRLTRGAAALAVLPAAAPAALRAATVEPAAPGRVVPGRHTPGRRAPLGPPPRLADEDYWEQVKHQFALRDGIVPMNSANLCPAPYTVQRTLFDAVRDVDADVSFQNRAKYGDIRERVRRRLATYLGVTADEVAIVRNTSEGNNIVVGGLELGPGDEVLVYDQNHPTNDVAWDVRAARYGFRVRRVSVDEVPWEPGALVDAFRRALSARTRVIAFTDVSNVTGLRLPAAALCRLARERGIHAHVDGAQSFGCLNVDLRALGCDSYATSAHKWFMGPDEAGVLFVRAERIPALWPGMVGVGWGGDVEPSAEGARKFETLGQRNDGNFAALGAALDFHELIGPDRIEARVLELAAALRDGLAGVPRATFVTPADAELSAGVLITRFDGLDGAAIYRRLYEEHGIAGAPTGGLRLCPHVYNTMEDVERAVSAVGQVVGGMA